MRIRYSNPKNNDLLVRGEVKAALLDDTPADSDAETLQRCIEAINRVPAADVAPVRHGRWIQTKDGDFACSLCGYIVKGEPMNYPPDGQMMLRMKGHRYCGDCGAKMEWGGDDA